jgi:hypothetical protein
LRGFGRAGRSGNAQGLLLPVSRSESVKGMEDRYTAWVIFVKTERRRLHCGGGGGGSGGESWKTRRVL